MTRENSFQAKIIKELHNIFPEAIVLKNDSNYLQGFPDILILFENTWAALEVKDRMTAPHKQPNQEYYVNLLNEMSYASFIYPENWRRVLDELQQTFRVNRAARVSKRF